MDQQSHRLLLPIMTEVFTHPYDLWTGVVGGPAGGLQQAASRLQGGHAEVCHLYIVPLIQQQVFGFQITVTERTIFKLSISSMFYNYL